MMRKELWLELEPKWPFGYWDDWLREPPQRKGRQVTYLDGKDTG
jgi:alpha-1,3-mannosyl-glycoprotein beta-1,2-N-acetylglucosaminyltransferase